MRPVGLGGTKTLQDLFTDRKVPRSLRRSLPVVCAGDEVVWVAGVALDERWAEGPRTSYEAKYEIEGRPILRLEAFWEASPAAPLHPRGAAAVLAATFQEEEEEKT